MVMIININLLKEKIADPQICFLQTQVTLAQYKAFSLVTNNWNLSQSIQKHAQLFSQY